MGGKGSGRPGVKRSKKHVKAMSDGLKKMYAKMTPAERSKLLAAAHKALREGDPWPAERRAAQSARQKGKKLSAAHKKKVSLGLKRYHAKRRKAEKK